MTNYVTVLLWSTDSTDARYKQSVLRKQLCLKLCFQRRFETFKEGSVRIDCGSAFHYFEAEYEKEWSYNSVRDLGTERSPFSDDLKERVWVSDTGLSRPDIYAGAKLFSALYVNIALMYIKRLGTESHSSLSNMIVEGVIKSALKMIRAARFCNLERRSIFAAVVFPQVLQP